MKEKTKSNIEKYGWEVIMIEETDYLPSFAYTIGLMENFKHPEIIILGLKIQTSKLILNQLGEKIRNGDNVELNKRYDDFFENALVSFLEVENDYIHDYFGYALNYYQINNLSAYQLVWSDVNKRFPWEEDFEAELKFKQPLLDRNTDFKFLEEKNLGVFTTKQFLEQDFPIIEVVHDVDGDWQFITEYQNDEDVRVVCLEDIIKKDKTLNELFDLDFGEMAKREKIGSNWSRSALND
jgi:hypothetical protein